MANNKTAIALEIEELRKNSDSETYLEALLNYCDIHNIDYEKPQQVNSLLTDTLKAKLKDEAAKNRTIIFPDQQRGLSEFF